MPWTVKDVEKHKKGLTDTQKRKWVDVANAIRLSCLKSGKTEKECDALAIRTANSQVGTNVQADSDLALKLMKTHKNSQIAYEPEAKTIAGKEYLIIPVVMIREGVHCGSAGPLLHVVEELEKSVPLWDGKPVTISHPSVNGVFVSADDPTVLANWAVGEVHDVRMEGDKLRANAWLDVQKLAALSPDTLTMIQNCELIEVSVGVFSEEEPTAGEWKGEQYTAINRNYIPDHLALLPGEVGACSIMDGCGVRVNSVNKQKGGELNVLKLEMLNDLSKQGMSVSPIVNEVSFTDIMDQIWSVIDRKSNDRERLYLDAVYDDYFIYRKRMITKSDDGELNTTEDAGYFKQNYQIGADDKVDFVGEPVKVKKTVSYVTLQEHVTMRRTKFSNNNKKKEDTNMCKPCKEKAGLLIANANTHYSEEHREWLESLEEDKLDILIANVATQPKVNQTQTPPEVTKEQAWQTLGLSKEQYEAGVKFYNEQRSELIQTILNNSEKDADGKPILAEKDFADVKLDVLRKMAKVIKPVKQNNNAAMDQQFANYSGMGGGSVMEDECDEEPLVMPGIELKN
jgi:hypothetical protein